MTVSPKRQMRQANGRKSALKERFVRHLRLENLERRELMAADVAPFHNYLMPHDVDGDYRISPLDALIVINQLNTAGSGSLQDRTPPSNRSGLIDTDGDNTLSPLDALTVINSLNGGEGETIKAAVKYEFYLLNADGTLGRNLDPNPNDSVSEAIVNTGEKFVVRTLMADFRNNPFGVFSAYHDLSYINSDGSTGEKMELQWSDYNALRIGMPNLGGGSIAILTGSFKLQYGTERTGTIDVATRIPAPGRPPVTDAVQTAANVQAALEQLPSIGAGNVVVRVNTIDPALGYNFDIFFRNARARTDMPAPTIEEANFTVSSGGAPTPSISDIVNPDPSNADAARGALNYNFAGQNPLYVNGPNGLLEGIANTPGGRRLNLLGGFSNSSATIPQPQAFDFFNIVDTAFVGAVAGTVNLRGSISPLPIGASGNNLGIALYNDGGAYLTESQVTFEDAFVRIVDRLTAVNDMFPVNEDAAPTSLNVGGNDTERDGFDFGIVGVTQPTNGAGSVSFVNNGTAKSVLFTPALDFFGPSTFTYTIRSTRGDESTATVTLDVLPVNDRPVVINLAFDATEDQTSPLIIAATDVFSTGPANESDQTMLPLTIVTGPTADQGTATINQATGNLEFIPAPDFFGTVNITVIGTDSGPNAPPPNVNNTTATLTITVAAVNDAPRIVGTVFSIEEDPQAPLSITPAQLFTPGPANESDQIVTLSIQSGPSSSQGTASIASNGFLVFSPAANFFGPVTMTILGTDNGSPAASTPSLITINVTPVNDPPEAIDDTGSADRFVAIGLTGLSSNLDVMRNDNAGPFEVDDVIRIEPFANSTTALGGTVSINQDGTLVVYTPPVGVFNVVDSFTYTIKDSGNLTDSAVAEVFIAPPVLPFAVDDSFTVAESTDAIRLHTFDVLLNDLINEDATPRLVSIVTQPQSGRGTASIVGTGNRADRIQYNAPQNFFGTAVIEYSMIDSDEESEAANAFLTVRVTEVNDPPVAVDLEDAGTEDIVKFIAGESITTGLSRGPFEDFQTLTVTDAIVRSGGGSLVLNNGDITYTPAKDYFGLVEIEYEVTDNGTTNGVNDFKSSRATLTLDIAPVNDPPVVSPKTFGATEDIVLPIAIADVIAGDVAGPANEIAAGQVVSFVDLTGPIATTRGGTITQNGTQLLYTPAADFNGTDSFEYTVTDGQDENQFAIGTVTITVSEVNDAPIANNIRKTVFAGVNTVIDVTAELAAMSRGAANEADQTLVMSRRVTDPDQGEIRAFGATQLTYFAPLGTDGTTTFQFEVIDNGTTGGELDAKTSVATFTIEILPFIPSSLKGFVFIDDNANGILDRSPTTNEPLELPIGGVEVTLTYADEANPGRMISMTEMTEADGSYDFELLPPGVYTVSYSTPLLMTNDSNATMSYTRTILAPGDDNFRFDFPVLGIIPEYGSHLEYLASSFYNRDGSLRSRGMYAALSADGITDWTSRKDGFDSGVFHELVLSDDGTRAYLTEVKQDGRLYTATLNERRQFIRMKLDDGRQLVRVLASGDELNWVAVNPATPPITARGYLETVDDFFEQEGWMWP
jgi:large repetitive protein